MKALTIRRHPSLPQGPSTTGRTEPGLDPNKAHNFMPLRPIIIISTSTTFIPIPGAVPKNPDGSRVGVQTTVTRFTGGSERGESEEERDDGEDEEGGEDQDR